MVKKVYLVTSNKHKIAEISSILSKYGIEVEGVKLPKIEIQHTDLREIVRFALELLKDKTQLRPLVMDDSGLFIEYLKGFPGPFSRYVYDTIGLNGVLKLMNGVKRREAKFMCAAGCLCPDDSIKVILGSVEGEIAFEARGNRGFGFDPIFIPKGYKKTFAELPTEIKNELSHRSRAFRRLAEEVLSLYGDTE